MCSSDLIPFGTSRIILGAERDREGKVEISVRDFGEGLSSERLPHVFEPFFTTKTNGMGMGLAISKTIIEAHGGVIRARNNPDRGATFSFTLPAERPAATAAQPIRS